MRHSIPLALLVGLLLVGSCADGETPVNPGPPGRAALTVLPEFAPASRSASAPSIRRVRLTATQVGSGRVLATETVEVDPEAAPWTLEFDVPIPETGEPTVTVLLELVGIRDGEPVVVYSGESGPVFLGATTPTDVGSVQVFPGPPDNLAVTDVEITDPGALRVGMAGSFEFEIRTSDPDAAPRTDWFSSDPSILRVGDEGSFQALATGTVEVRVAAGPASDRITVEVGPPKADLRVVKTASVRRVGPGGEVTFTVRVTNGGPDVSRGRVVEDLVPTGLEVRDVRIHGGADATVDPSRPAMLLPELAPGASATMIVVATVGDKVADGTELENLAELGQGGPDEVDPSDENDRDRATVTVEGREADLRVVKTASVRSVRPGGEVTFTVQVTNEGPDVSKGRVLEDLLPAGLEVTDVRIDGGADGTVDPSRPSMLIPELAPNASATMTVVAAVGDGVADGTELENLAELDQGGPEEVDPSDENDRDRATVTVRRRRADLALQKTVNNAAPRPGAEVVFRITVTNLGPDVSRGRVVEDLVPAGLEVRDVRVDGGTDASVDPSRPAMLLPELAPGVSATLTVVARVSDDVSAGTRLTNRAEVGDGATDEVDVDPENNAAEADLTVHVAEADLVVTKSADPGVAAPGQTVTFTVEVRNDGPSVSRDRILEDLVPDGMSVSRIDFQGGVSATVNPDDPRMLIRELEPGETTVMTVTATVDEEIGELRELLNVAELSAPGPAERDPNPENDRDEATVELPFTDVSVTKSADASRVSPGGQVVFQIQAENLGRDPATGVQISDVLPDGLNLVSHTATDGTYDPGTGIWSVGGLASRGSAFLQITADADPSSLGSTLTNRASLSAVDQDDGNTTNDSDDASVEVVARADLRVEKVVDDATPEPGQRVTYTITVTNLGPDAAPLARLADDLPAGLLDVRVVEASQGTAGLGTLGLPTDDMGWDIGSIPVGSSVTLTYSGEISSGLQDGHEVVNATLGTLAGGDAEDPSPDNNSASATATVTFSRSDLAVEKAVDNTAPKAGDRIEYTLTVTNNGPDPATSITLTDGMPAGVSDFQVGTPSQGTADMGLGGLPADALGWQVGSLPVGASATVTVSVRVDAAVGTELTNGASVVSGDLSVDPVTSNDTDAVTATVAETVADVQVAKSVDAGSARAGEAVTWTVTVTNAGPDATASLGISESLPTGLQLDSHTTTSGTFDTQTSEWTIGSLAPGATATLTLTTTVTPDATGDLVNTAFGSDNDTSDPESANNSAEATVTVLETAPNPSYDVPGNVDLVGGSFTPPTTPHVTDAAGVLAGTTTLTVSSTGSSPTTQGGTVEILADGSFLYRPPVGFSGTDDFTYGTADGQTGTATVTVGPTVWFVDNARSTGDGSARAPHPDLGQIPGLSDPGDFIFLFQGAGPYDPITLQNDQAFLGEAAGLTLPDHGSVIAPTANRPVIRTGSSSANVPSWSRPTEPSFAGLDVDGTGGGVALNADNASGSLIDDVTITSSGGRGISLDGAGQITIRNTTVSDAGGPSIAGDGVGELTVEGGRFLGSGAPGTPGNDGIRITNPTGTITLRNTEVSGSGDVGVRIETTTTTPGPIDLLGEGLTLENNDGGGALIAAGGGATVSGGFGGGTIRNNGGPGFDIEARDDGTLDLELGGSTTSEGNVVDANGGAGIRVTHDGDAGLSLRIRNNAISDHPTGIRFVPQSTPGSAGTGDVLIADNAISNVTGSEGIFAQNARQTRFLFDIRNNQVTGVETGAGMQIRAGTSPVDEGSARTHAVILNNHVEMPTDNDASPYFGSSESGALCLDFQGNRLTGGSPFAFTAFAQPTGSTFYLPGFNGGSGTVSDVGRIVSFIADNNPDLPNISVTPDDGFTGLPAGSCDGIP